MALRNGWPDAVLGDLYPFEDQYFQLADGTSMHYVEMGSARFRRPTLLLLHGNPTWSFLWRRFLPALSRNARVVAVDHVGFGRSDHPEDVRYHSLERHVANLEEFIGGLGLKRVVPVVQDWGGPIGLGWATRHRDELAGLGILNTWAFTEKVPMRLPFAYKALRAPIVGDLACRRANVFIERFLPRLLMDAPDDLLDAYRHPFSTADSRSALVAMPRMVPDRPGHPGWATMDRIEKALPSLDVPARIVWGARDPAFPKRFAWAFSEMLPKAGKPVFLPDAGHFLQEDAPQQVIEELAGLVKSV